MVVMFGKRKTNNNKMVWLWTAMGAIVATVSSISTLSKEDKEKSKFKLPIHLKLLKWALLVIGVIVAIVIWNFLK